MAKTSQMSPSTNIEDLPPEMITQLFRLLFDLKNPKDLIACSMVNKRWHSIYLAFKVDRLIAVEDLHFYLSRWFPDQKIDEDKELCRPDMFGRLTGGPLLSNLKYLGLCGKLVQFDLDKLNELGSQLVHLEINIKLSRKKVNLSLQQLKVLVLHQHNYLALSIDSPKLSVLVFAGKPVNLKHPETVRTLDTDRFGSELAAFKGVQCLKTRRIEAISSDTLVSLPALNELHYSMTIEDLVRDVFKHELGTIDRIKRTLSDFLDELERTKRRDFQFEFGGFEMTKMKLDEFDFGLQVMNDREFVSNRYINENN